MIHFLRWFAGGGGAGFMPFAPGTWGSGLAVLLMWYMPEQEWGVWIGLILLLTVAGAMATRILEMHHSIEDPGWIVIDEVVGQWITLLFAPKTLVVYLLGFVLFRVFDISKPWIIDRSQKIGGGWGVMLDDVLAGLAGMGVLQLLMLAGIL